MRRAKMKMADRGPCVFFRKHLAGTCLSFLIFMITSCGGELWPLERPEGMPVIQSLEVMCGKDHMDVHLSFSHPFEGIVSSKGQHGDPRCVYVPPSTGKTFFSFRIAYARCGTKPDLHGQFYENTVVVQYDKDLLEVWDEAKRLRCEWFNDYEKTASKPPMVIADLDVIQLDFRGDNVDCWMEIQNGKGPWAPPVSGIVPLGSTLTLVVAINDYRGEFDMRVKSCAASDGAGHIIDLSDEAGCVLRPKMISRFLKAKAADDRASVITYAFFHAFKFPDALSVHIKCKVEICRHGCQEHCQSTGHYGALERKDDQIDHQKRPAISENVESNNANDNKHDGALYEDNEDDDGLNDHMQRSPQQVPKKEFLHNYHEDDDLDSQETIADLFARPFADQPRPSHRDGQERFPHGPRQLEELNLEDPDGILPPLPVPLPAVAGPRNLNIDELPLPEDEGRSNKTPKNRKRRSVVISDGKARSADVGVNGLYEVISEADLAFSPDSKAEAVTVFQGRIREEVVYGICLPVSGFSALFVLVAVCAVASALAAGALLYRYQLQREKAARQPPVALAAQSLSSWMALRLLRARTPPAPTPTHQQHEN